MHPILSITVPVAKINSAVCNVTVRVMGSLPVNRPYQRTADIEQCEQSTFFAFFYKTTMKL